MFYNTVVLLKGVCTTLGGVWDFGSSRHRRLWLFVSRIFYYARSRQMMTRRIVSTFITVPIDFASLSIHMLEVDPRTWLPFATNFSNHFL